MSARTGRNHCVDCRFWTCLLKTIFFSLAFVLIQPRAKLSEVKFCLFWRFRHIGDEESWSQPRSAGSPRASKRSSSASRIIRIWTASSSPSSWMSIWPAGGTVGKGGRELVDWVPKFWKVRSWVYRIRCFAIKRYQRLILQHFEFPRSTRSTRLCTAQTSKFGVVRIISQDVGE